MVWGAFGVMEGYGAALVLPVALAVIFCCTFARIWGVPAQTVGNVLVVVLCLALDRAMSVEQGALVAAMFWAGGLWAAFLALVVWRLHPYRPAHAAIGGAWRGLSRPRPRTCAALGRSAGHRPRGVGGPRAGPSPAVRDAIEAARNAGARPRPAAGRGSRSANARALIRLEAPSRFSG